MKCLPAKDGIKLIMPKTRQAKPRGNAHKSADKASGESKYFSRAVGKAIQMLEMLTRSGEPMSLSELSKQTELTKSSAFRLLQTLETLHYIRRDGNGHYLPSNENVSVISSQYVNAVVTAAREPMRRLNMEFGEPARSLAQSESRLCGDDSRTDIHDLPADVRHHHAGADHGRLCRTHEV